MQSLLSNLPRLFKKRSGPGLGDLDGAPRRSGIPAFHEPWHPVDLSEPVLQVKSSFFRILTSELCRQILIAAFGDMKLHIDLGWRDEGGFPMRTGWKDTSASDSDSRTQWPPTLLWTSYVCHNWREALATV